MEKDILMVVMTEIKMDQASFHQSMVDSTMRFLSDLKAISEQLKKKINFLEINILDGKQINLMSMESKIEIE